MTTINYAAFELRDENGDPMVIKAVRITDEWFDGEHPNPCHPVGVVFDPRSRTVHVATIKGEMIDQVGDWLITGVRGSCTYVSPTSSRRHTTPWKKPDDSDT